MSDEQPTIQPRLNGALPRPVLIDEADGPCPFCEEWANEKFAVGDGKQRCCDQCRQPIPNYPGCNGAGVIAVLPHHFHLRGIGPASLPGRVAIFQELCKECAIAMRIKIYPPGTTDSRGRPHLTEEYMRDFKG